jgi:hypothetical protein
MDNDQSLKLGATPVSDDEFDKLGAVTVSDDEFDKLGAVNVEQSSAVSEPSNVGDLLRSIAEGATFGGADEIYGALAAAGKKVTGSDESLADLYRHYQQESQQSYKDIQQRSPVLSTVGELGGGLATGMLLPLGGFAKGASLGTRVAAGALEGGILSGASSALKSEHALGTKEHAEDMGKDILYGGALGGAMGAAAPKIEQALSKAGGYISKEIEDSPKLKKILQAYEHGKAGEAFVGEEATTKIQDKLNQAAKEVSGGMVEARDLVGKEMQKYGDQGIDATGLFKSLKNEFDNILEKHPTASVDSSVRDAYSNIEKVLGEITEEGASLPTVKELQFIKETMSNIGENTNNSFAREMANKAYADISDFMKKNAKEYTKYSDIFQDLASSSTDVVLGKQFRNVSGGREQAVGEVTSGMKDLLSKAERAGAGPVKLAARENYNNLIKRMSEFSDRLQKSDASPELIKELKKTGILDPEQFLTKSKDAAGLQEIMRLIQKENPQGGMMQYATAPIKIPLKAMGLMRETGAGTGLQLAKQMGAGNRLAGNLTKPVSNVINKFYSMTDSGITSVLDSMENAGVGKNLTGPLKQAIANKDEFKKRAIMFSLMQTPEVREHVEKVMGGED